MLGVGIMGVRGEPIAEAVLAIKTATTVRDLAMVVHPHPTLSESLGEAAEMLYGTATHAMRTKK